MLASGCASALSPEVTAAADPRITFSRIQAEPDANQGATVILGGVIAVVRSGDQRSEIEIVQKELDLWGKPRRTDRTGGKFLVRSRGFFDPRTFSPGREITVGGTIAAPAGTLPVIDLLELRLWDHHRPAPGDPSFMDPLSDRGR